MINRLQVSVQRPKATVLAMGGFVRLAGGVSTTRFNLNCQGMYMLLSADRLEFPLRPSARTFDDHTNSKLVVCPRFRPRAYQIEIAYDGFAHWARGFPSGRP